MAFDGMKKFFGVEGNNDDNNELIEETNEDGFYNVSKEEAAMNPNFGSNKMILFEPRAYSEATQITDFLKNRKAVNNTQIARTKYEKHLTNTPKVSFISKAFIHKTSFPNDK